ncbi:hypothetical protein [Halobacterium zhouii]|uniref:hypothetical protein n=1 Tax=Halobacterium zhouii TaxID=2902624 RepID=UPI001E636A7E|nr:hypothetical protein [Halobacterium zhouii]
MTVPPAFGALPGGMELAVIFLLGLFLFVPLVLVVLGVRWATSTSSESRNDRVEELEDEVEDLRQRVEDDDS